MSGEGGGGLEGVLSGGQCRMWEAQLQQVVQLADEGLDRAGSLPWPMYCNKAITMHIIGSNSVQDHYLERSDTAMCRPFCRVLG